MERSVFSRQSLLFHKSNKIFLKVRNFKNIVTFDCLTRAEILPKKNVFKTATNALIILPVN